MSKRPDDKEIRDRLTPEQYRVTQEAGTEPAFSGCLWDEKRSGQYRCVVCESKLFLSGTKFDSGSGWPSFWRPVDETAIAERQDDNHGMSRTEVVCGQCDAHLGHVFPDGPAPTGQRYCINSASLIFEPEDV